MKIAQKEHRHSKTETDIQTAILLACPKWVHTEVWIQSDFPNSDITVSDWSTPNPGTNSQ